MKITNRSIQMTVLFLTAFAVIKYGPDKAKADVPAVPPNLVSCTCTTDSVQTCLSGGDYSLFYFYTSCTSPANVYSVSDYTTMTPDVFFNSWQSGSGNRNVANGRDSGVSQGNTNSIAACNTLGCNSNVACARSNVIGTLHLTGKYVYQYGFGGEYAGSGGYGSVLNYSCY